jgi:hypothetical protein
MLLHALFTEAAQRGVGLCLNVRHDNPAQRLYERVGFRLVPGSGVPNRVGGTSFGMLWAVPPVTAGERSRLTATTRRSRESGNPGARRFVARPLFRPGAGSGPPLSRGRR